MYSRVWIFLILIQSTSINKVVSENDFCKIQSNICVRFCPTAKQDHDWKPTILKEAERNGTGKSLDLNPNCNLTNNLFIIDSRKPEFDIDIISNGNLSWGGKIWPNEFYCISRKSDETSKPKDWQVYYLCIDKSITQGDYEEWVDKVDLKLIPGLLMISMIFLVLAFIHTFLEQRGKLFGCMLLNLILMQFILFLTLTIVKLSNHLDEKPNLCKFEGFLIQFSQMSAFFWLSALGHNVQKTFKKMRPVSTHRRRYKLGIIDDNYKWYALYAWGIPLVVSFITILMQYRLPEEKTEKYYVPPGIGENACFLEPKWGMLFYFHIINGPIMIITFGFFIYFIWNICFGVYSLRNESIKIRENDGKRERAVIKMFFVMGPTWIMEIIGWALKYHSELEKDTSSQLFLLFDVVNSLQGFFLFFAIYLDDKRISKINHLCSRIASGKTKGNLKNVQETPNVPTQSNSTKESDYSLQMK